MDVLVVGAGAVGLTTAISLAEAGLSVTIRTAELPAKTTSVAAGAVWGAVKVGPPGRVLGMGPVRAGGPAQARPRARPGGTAGGWPRGLPRPAPAVLLDPAPVGPARLR